MQRQSDTEAYYQSMRPRHVQDTANYRNQRLDEGGIVLATAKTTLGNALWTIGRLLRAGDVSTEVRLP